MASGKLQTAWYFDTQSSVNAATATFAAVTPEAVLGLTGSAVDFEWELLGKTAGGNVASYRFFGSVANVSGVATVYLPAATAKNGLAALILSVPAINASVVSSQLVITPSVLGVALNTISWDSWIRFWVN